MAIDDVVFSGYYGFVNRMNKPEKDAHLAGKIREQQSKCFQTYGYRRMWQWLKSQNIYCNPKTVLRIMKKYDLLSSIRCHGKWRHMGQQLHKFHAESLNSKWVTDISYIQTKQGILYLPIIRDLYDNSIVAYKTGTQKIVNLVLGYYPSGNKAGEKESRRRVTAPQRPRLSIYLTSVLQPD